MALSLLETTDLYKEGGTLLARVTASCGLLAYTILSTPGMPDGQVAWAMSMQSNADATAMAVFKGVITSPTIQALNASDIRSGALPADNDLNTLVGEVLAIFAAIA